MDSTQEKHLTRLIEKRINNSISEIEMVELEETLLQSNEARELYLDLSYQHFKLTQLNDQLVQNEVKTPSPSRKPLSRRSVLFAIAAVVALSLFAIPQAITKTPKPIATLVSSEHATWAESLMPTASDSELHPGTLNLRSGIATIRFRSGAEMILEGPARLMLETEMKTQLLAGNAVIEVPEEAIGFIVETPDGYAVDHGTSFSVSVSENERASVFEVITGEISVHHPPSGSKAFLTTNQSAVTTAKGLKEINVEPEGDEISLPLSSWQARIRTNGAEASFVKCNKREKFLHPDLLMNFRGIDSPYLDRKFFLEFQVPTKPEGSVPTVEEARLSLNLVPSGIGLASSLPAISTFSVYGIPENISLPSDWSSSPPDWKQMPDKEKGVLLGQFEIQRGQSSGNFGIENVELSEFINQSRGGKVIFIVVRETSGIARKPLVHTFASSTHPEAAGPMLEVNYAR